MPGSLKRGWGDRLRTGVEVEKVFEVVDSGFEVGVQCFSLDLFYGAAVELEVDHFVGLGMGLWGC